MRSLIASLLLAALLGMMSPLLSAQQNQNAQQSDSEIEALKKRISELEKQLQTVANVEKIKLQTELAEANTKLINAEFGKFERELIDSNQKWLIGWILFFLAILSAVGVGVWSWLKNRSNQLIADTVDKNLNGFKEAVEQVEVMKDELGVLKTEHARSVLEGFNYFSSDEQDHPEEIKRLPGEDLFRVLDDKKYDLQPRYKAAAVLTARKSSQVAPPMLNLLNSALDSDSDTNLRTRSLLRGFVDLLGHIYTQEAYQGLNKILNRLLTADPEHKNLFLMKTVLSFTWVSIKLKIKDSVSIVRKAMSHFETPAYTDLSELVEYFDRFDELEGIREILTQHVTDGMPEVENRCLELLQKHDPEFVENRRAGKMADNSDS